MASDYTLSVRGEFKDDISKELGGVAGVVSGFKDNFKSAAQGALSFGDVLRANVLSDAIVGGLQKLKDGLIDAGKAAYAEGAALEQSLGGVETLFKDNADTVKKYADEAYKSAGLSANEYMESVTGISAALISSLGGDTATAAEAANQAIIDMADNANKMGTSMDSIQNAYAGFAKQNYTMLDNLKLGYGGTKAEMERLLADAEKISGVHYDINNLADVYSAIHVIQTELDITGTTAKEASQTLSGSFAAMGSAWKNVLGKLTIGDDITDELGELKDSVLTFADNLIPAIGNMVDQLPAVFDGLIGTVGELIPKIGDAIAEHADALLDAGHTLLTGIIDGIVTYAPGMIQGALSIVKELGSAIISNAPQLLKAGKEILASIIDGIAGVIPDIISTGAEILSGLVEGMSSDGTPVLDAALNLINTLMDAIQTNLPTIVEAGLQVLTGIIGGIIEALPQLVDTGLTIITTIIDAVITNLPMIVEAGLNLVGQLVMGIAEALPTILDKGIEIVDTLITGITDNLQNIWATGSEIIQNIADTITEKLPEILQKGVEILTNLVDGILENLPMIISTVGEIITTFVDFVLDNLPAIMEAGVELLMNLVQGIVDNLPEIAQAVIHVIGEFVKTVGEHLPEILETGLTLIGELIAGLIKAIPDVIAAIPDIIKAIVDEFLGYDWIGLGGDIIAGIGKGLANLGGAVWDGITSAGEGLVNGFKDFFGINSPSRLMADQIGRFIPEGIAVGIDANTSGLERSVARMNKMVLSDVSSITANTSAAGYGGASNQNTYNYGGFNLSVYGAEGQDEETLADIIEARIRARMSAEEAVFA